MEDIKICYYIPYFKFDKLEVKLECTKTKENLFFDAVLLQNKKRVIDFESMKAAILEYNFLITSKDRKLGESYRDDEQDGKLYSKLITDKFSLSLNTLMRPGKEIECLTTDEQFINGVKIEKQLEYIKEIKNNYKIVQNLFEYEDNKGGMVDKRIIDSIENIKHNSFNDNCECISFIINIVEENNYDDDTKRKIMILMLNNLFEVAKTYNFTFEKMINKNFHDIYQRRIFADKPNVVWRDILKSINSLKDIGVNLEKERSIEEIIEKCKKMIDENLLERDLSIEFISDKVGCSAGYLSRIFHTHTKMRYVDYVQQEKISFALHKIQEENMTIKEVSEMLGYSSPNNFMRMFKKVKGKTVSEYLEIKK